MARAREAPGRVFVELSRRRFEGLASSSCEASRTRRATFDLLNLGRGMLGGPCICCTVGATLTDAAEGVCMIPGGASECVRGDA
jgi:hypothetical protein